MGTPDRKAFLPAPVSLLPVSVSKELWEPLRNISADFDSLYNKVARDHDFLIEHLSKTAQADAFSARLVQILQDQIKEGIRQEIMFQINRNDYMWHDPVSSFKQVEFNSISAAFGYLSTKVAEMHSFMLERFLGIKDVVQVQQAHIGIAKGIHAAVEAFRRSEKVDGVLLMIVQPNERNSVDQRGIEYALWTQFRIPVIRRSLLEISTQGSLNSEKHLVIDGNIVALSYFRAGYTPNDYPSENEWNARRLIEKSSSIKCPSIGYHLAGSKKIQQCLAQKANVTRFVSEDRADKILHFCASLWPLDEEDCEEVIKKAVEDPARFVLKPQREGGGNNFYGEAMKRVLQESSKEELSAFILMERLFPKFCATGFVKNGEVHVQDGLSEFGIYSVYLSDESSTIYSEQVGYLVRTKAVGVDEGGVAAGYSVLNSVRLV